MHKRGICRHALSICPSVCVSVTFVSCAKTNKDIFDIFLPSASHIIPAFSHQTGWWYSDGNPLAGDPPTGGVECEGVWKNDDFRPIFCCIWETVIVRLIQKTLEVLSLLRPIVHDTSKTAKITWFILVLHWAVDAIEVIYFIHGPVEY